MRAEGVGRAAKPCPLCLVRRAGPVRPLFGKSEKNFFEIDDPVAADFNALVLEQLDFLRYRGAPCPALESPHPTGCGHNPMSGYLGRIGVLFHGLADPAIGFGIQGMGNFLVGRYPPFRHRPQ